MSCIAIIVFSFAGCSNNKDLQQNPNTKQEVSIDKDSTKIEGDDVTFEVAHSIKSEVEIPDDFPVDIAPIYKNAKALAVTEQPGGYGTILLTNDKVSKVTEFYKEFYKDIAILSTNEEEDTYEMIGSYNGYTITVLVYPETETEGYLTAINLIVVEGEIPTFNMEEFEIESIPTVNQ